MQLAVGAGRLSNDLSLDGLYHWSDAVLVSEVTARLDELNHLLGGGALIATPGLVNDPEGAAPHDRPFGSQGWAGTRVRLLPAHGRTENAPVLLAPLSLPDGAALRSVVQVAARDGVSGARWPVLSAAYESLLRYAPADGDGSEPLVLQRSDHHCRRYGSFYTGHALARSVVEAALAPLLPVTGVPSSHLSILDPAMGTGIFLVETVRALVDRGIATGAEVAATWLHGYDVDPVAVELAILSLWIETGARPDELSRNLRCLDALEQPLPASPFPFGAVVGNPPWGARYAPETRKRLAERWPASSRGSFDSFKLFLQLAAESTAGTMGMIVPRAVLSQARHADVRALLLERLAPYRIWTLPENAFSPAVAPACALVFGPKPGPEAIRHIAWEEARSAEQAVPTHLWTRDRFPLSGGTLLDLLRRLRERHPALGELDVLYCVRDVGINYNRATVSERVLYTAAEPEDPRDLPRYRGRDFTRYGDIVRSGWLRHDAQERLLPGEYLSMNLDTFRLPEKVVFRQTADRIVATMDRSRMCLGRSVIAVTREGDASLLGLLACLNSRLLTALYRALAGETGRILPQVKVATMRLLPLPRACLPGKRSRKWEQLEALAAALLSCGGADAGLDRSIDRLIYDIYGLSPEEIAIVENSYTQGGEALK